ncbi:MAG: hypothetical protein JNL05_12015 [Flavobacteriales bacterium]|nr:hypothetical protein [Flavobacteriales bacterium]
MSELRQIKLKRLVSQGLHGYANSILPQEIATQPTVKWVLGFDSLLKKPYGESQSLLLSVDQAEGTSHLVLRALSILLENTLPGYFGSLYHIARMYEVGRSWKRDLEQSASSENMKLSIEKLSATIREEEKLEQAQAEQKAEKILKGLAGNAQLRCKELKALAERWFAQWIKEVDELRSAVKVFEETWSSSSYTQLPHPSPIGLTAAVQLAQICQRDSQLLTLMEEEGVIVKRPKADPILKIGTLPLLFALAGSVTTSYDFLRTLSDWASMDRKVLMLQNRHFLHKEYNVAMNLLSRKYGDENPFDRYLPLVNPASLELRELMKEHVLPTGEPSLWRESWEKRLELTGRPSTFISHSGRFNSNDIQWLLRLVDSAVKARLDGPLRPNEDWHGFVQRLFYSNAITILFWNNDEVLQQSQLVRTRRFSFSRYYGLMKIIVDAMNEHGYQFDHPTREQFETLVAHVDRGSATENYP